MQRGAAGNSLPQKQQGSILPLILRTNERSSELKRRTQLFEESLVVAEQGAGIKSANTALSQDLSGASRAISSDELSLGRIPEQDVPVVLVEGIEITALACALAGLTESQFPQAPHFQQRVWDF